MYHYVYQITNLLNGMIYVGKRSSKKQPDIDSYFGSGIHLKHAIKKYGKENFKKEIIAIVNSAEDAEELEEIIVDVDFIARKDTYNMIIGGQKGSRGLVMSEETKAKLSESHKGHTVSEETKAKISAVHKGKKLSEEHKSKMLATHKGKKLSDETKAKMSAANKGKNHSDETKAKISSANKGKRLSDDHKTKISAANKGKKRGQLSDEHKAKASKAAKGRIWINNGEIAKRVKPEDADAWFHSGFMLGKLK